MGAQNVAKVFANWRHLSHREARALLFMANTALDADKPPVYFGGWQAVAEALGLDPEGRLENAKEQFRRTIAGLVTSGAVVSSGQAKLKVRAEYALALDPEATFQPAGTGRNIGWQSVPRSVITTEKVPHMGHPKGAPVSTEKVPHVGHSEGGKRGTLKVPPRSTEEPLGGIPDEEIRGIQSGGALSLTNAREPERQTGSFTGPAMEDERRRQMEALQKIMGKEKAS